MGAALAERLKDPLERARSYAGLKLLVEEK
jgi:hypothetical protein